MINGIQNEFNLFKGVIHALWACPNRDDMDKLITEVFNSGLAFGRFWVDSGANHRVEAKFSKKLGKGHLDKRTVNLVDSNPIKFVHDHFEVLDRWLLTMASELHNYTVDNIHFENRVRKFEKIFADSLNLSELAPRDMSRNESDEILKNYKGMRLCSAGEWTTLERLTKEYAEYRREDANSTPLFALIAAIFTHGMYTAREFNTQAFEKSLTALYKKGLEKDFGLDMKSTLDAELKSNVHLALLNDFSPINLISQDEFDAILAGGSKPTKGKKEDGEFADFIKSNTERLIDLGLRQRVS